MEIIWEEKSDEDVYEVMRDGDLSKLYRNGVLHSQWSDHRPLAGSVWDLLVLPSLFNMIPTTNALFLGVGGGASIRQYLELLPVEEITGVELDPTLIEIAKQCFGLDRKGVRLIESDAVKWVKDAANGNGDTYSAIIDDLYTEVNGGPVKIIPSAYEWLEQLTRLLKPGGIVIVNFANRFQLDQVLEETEQLCVKHFDACYHWGVPQLSNCVAAFVPDTYTPIEIHKKFRNIRETYPQCSSSLDKYKMGVASIFIR